MPDIIFDTNVLSNFAKADQLALLRDLYPENACCSGFVVSEVMRGFQQRHHDLEPLAAWLISGWPRMEELTAPDERKLFAAISISLGAGESSCLALADSRGYIFACDDRLARNEAIRLGITLTGTLGILIKAAQTEHLELKAANRILQRMIKAGFYAPISRIEL